MENKANLLSNLRTLIAQGHLALALEKIRKFGESQAHYRWAGQNALQLQARFHQLQDEKSKGILDTRDVEKRENVLLNDTLRLVDQLEKGRPDPVPPMLSRLVLPGLALLVLIAAGYFLSRQFFSPSGKFNLVLLVQDAGGQPLTEGSLSLRYPGSADFVSKAIGSNGELVLTDLEAEVRGQALSVHPQVEGYASDPQRLIVPAEENELIIRLAPKKESTTVRGAVLDQNNQPISGALVKTSDSETITDQLGEFELELPYAPGTRLRFRIYLDDYPIYNGQQTISGNFLSIPTKYTVN